MTPNVSNTERAEPSEAHRQALHSAWRAIGNGSFNVGAQIIAELVADETAELRKRVGELETYRDICNKVIKDDEAEFDRLNSLLELAQDEAAELRRQLEEANADNVKLQKVIFGCKDHDNEFEKQIEHLRAQLELAQGDKEDRKRLDWLEAQANGLIIWRGVLSKDGSPIVDIHEPREEGLDDACGEELSQGATLRAAIDSARGKGESK